MYKIIYLLALIIFLPIVSSCFKPSIRGYVFSTDMENENKIKNGMEKEEVIAILGISTFEIENKMYYISTKSKQHPFKKEQILEKNALIITLNESDTVADIKFTNTTLKNKKL